MRDYVLELVKTQTGYNAKLNIMREYLQAYILRVMHDEGLFRSVAFLGGTALRFLYNLPRFSEDLDFSTIDEGQINFLNLIKKLKDELVLSGYEVSINYNDNKIVNSAFIKFEGLMYDVGISPLKSQKFSIKLEIDTNPPKDAIFKTHIVNKYFPISFLSYNNETLFAGKLHALLSRKYTKGRDFFDLGWYLSKWTDITPNIAFLNNALKQTGWKGQILLETDWRDLIYKIVQKVDWKKVKEDVDIFLERSLDAEIFTKDNILSLLGKK